MPGDSCHEERRQKTILAVATFATLMHAYERGDLQTAAEAQAKLELLDLRVRFGRPRRQGKGATHE